jgi:hypothetical protein
MMTNHRLTVSFPLCIFAPEGVDVPGSIAGVLARDTFDDGRYDYLYELVADGLARLVRCAALEAAEKHFAAIHGPNTLEDCETEGLHGRRNVARHLAEEWVKYQLGGVMVEAGHWQVSIVSDDNPA